MEDLKLQYKTCHLATLSQYQYPWKSKFFTELTSFTNWALEKKYSDLKSAFHVILHFALESENCGHLMKLLDDLKAFQNTFCELQLIKIKLNEVFLKWLFT